MHSRITAHFFRRLGLIAASLMLAMGVHAAEVVGRVEVAEVTATGATMRWRTDVPTGSRVDYGMAPEKLAQKAEGGAIADAHVVTLTGLAPGTKYFFAVGTARRQLAKGEFTTAPAAGQAESVAPAAPSAPIATNRSSPPAAKSPPSPPPAAAPPPRQTWGNLSSLEDHFQRHGADVAAKNADDYARKAWEFRQRARKGELLAKVDDDGVQRVFDPKSGLFAAYNRDGTTKTFFKPDSRGYFERQPGKPVKAITP